MSKFSDESKLISIEKINSTGNLTTSEIKTLLELNQTYTEYDTEKTIAGLFEEQAARTPDNKALIFKNDTMTYQQLNEKSEQLAMQLRKRNVGTDKIVGIMIRRSMEMITAILAVLKAGAAYLPIDPEYPEERIRYMLQDSGAGILLTQLSLAEKLDFSGEKIFVEDQANYCSVVEGSGSADKKSDDLAYIIYTSGSTGNPKGVMIENRAVTNFIKGVTDLIDFTEQKTILALTTVSFDIFGLETILPLTKGLKVVIADENDQKNPRLLSELILENGIDMLQITPSRLQLLLNYEKGLHCLKNLKEIMIGGEAFPINLLEKIKKLTDAEIYNMYGPTETTIWSTIRRLTKSDKIDIGRPIANTQILVVDEKNELLPVGREGELCIAGDGLARGYFNKPELTAERFIQNPLLNSQRMYKTGDMGRWLPDGNIECLGRLDNQVKIRGYRIEVEEIESALRKHSRVRDAVVALKEGTDDNKYLCAYIISENDFIIDRLKDYLHNIMPEYMVPAHFIKLEELPYTPNGKIDRRALPKPDEIEVLTAADLSTDNKEAAPDEDDDYVSKIKSIFKEVAGLNIPDEKIDSITQMKLDSIVHMKVMIAIEMEFDMEFPVEDLVPDRFTTIRDIAKYVRDIN